jgi:hypothetical protein
MRGSEPRAEKGVPKRVEGVSPADSALRDEVLEGWKAVVEAAWSLSNLRSGLVDVTPRLKGLPEALNLLKESVSSIQQTSTLDTVEEEIQRAADDLKTFSEDLLGVRGILEETLQAIWRRRGAIKPS